MKRIAKTRLPVVGEVADAVEHARRRRDGDERDEVVGRPAMTSSTRWRASARRRWHREQGRWTYHAWCIGTRRILQPARRRLSAPSTRRISASAARPTSSCSSVGSRVPSTRCSSWPGPAQRARQRACRRGARTTRRPRRRRRSTPAGHRGAGQRRRALDRAAQQRGAGQVGGQQRRHEVRAAAVVLLGRVARVAVALLVGADRLVLDAVVGGEVAAAQRDERRRERQRGERGLAADAARAPAQRRAGDGGGAHRDDHRGVLEGQARLAAAPRLTSGMTAIASPRRTTPRTPGDRASTPPRTRGLGPEATAIVPSSAAHGRGPVRRAVDEQAVAQRHAAEAQLVVLVLSHRAAPWSTSR